MERGLVLPLEVTIGFSRLIQQDLAPYQHLVISGQSDLDSDGLPVQLLIHGATSAYFNVFFVDRTCDAIVPHEAPFQLYHALQIDKFGVEYVRAHDFCLVIYNKRAETQHLALNVSYYHTPGDTPTDKVTRDVIIAIASIFGIGFLIMGIGFAYRYYALSASRARNSALKAQLLPTGSLQESGAYAHELDDSDEEVYQQERPRGGRNPFRHSMLEEGFTDKY
jgi:hypothetical protein